MSSRPAGDQRGLHREATKCKSLVMFCLLTKEQTNPGRLGWSCGHTTLAMPYFRSTALLYFLSCPLPHTSKQIGAWEQLTASNAKALHAMDCNSLCSPALLKEKEKAVFLSSLAGGWGKEGERKLLSVLFILSWELSWGSQIWENIWIWDHGRLSPSTQHSNWRSAVRATAPALDAEFTRFGKVDKTEAQEPLCTLMLFRAFPGHSTVSGTPKEAHTQQRCSQNLFTLLFPKVLSPACSLCLPVVCGVKEKKEEQEGANITCCFQRWPSTAAGISRHILVMIVSTRTYQGHTERNHNS